VPPNSIFRRGFSNFEDWTLSKKRTRFLAE